MVRRTIFFAIVDFKTNSRVITPLFVAIACATICGAMLVGAAVAQVAEDPQTAERLWSTPNLGKIQKNYDGPTLTKEKAGDTKILISFVLQPDGRVTQVKAVKKSGDAKSRNDIDLKSFNAIESSLIKAIRRSSPLTYRKQAHEKKVPWGVLFIYCPKEYSFGRMIHVARPGDI